MNIPHFVYPFIIWWTFGLFLSFGYCEYYCSEHLCIHFCLDANPGVQFLSPIMIPCLTYQGIAKLFSSVSAPFFILTCNVGGFQFPHFLTNTCYIFLLTSTQQEYIFHCAEAGTKTSYNKPVGEGGVPILQKRKQVQERLNCPRSYN